MDYEPTSDELWQDAQDKPNVLEPDGTLSVPVQVEQDTAQEQPAAPEFDITPYLPQIAQYVRENELPQFQSATIEETMRRTKQSIQARDAAINARLAPIAQMLQDQEQQGVITPEYRQQQLTTAARNIRTAVDNEQQQAEYLAQLQAQQQAAQQQVPVAQWVLSTQDQFDQILLQSGLTADDPEYTNLPQEITIPDPHEAVDYYRVKVTQATEAKQKRLGITPTRSNGKPRREAPMMDTGMGGGAGRANPIAGVEDTDELWRMAQGG